MTELASRQTRIVESWLGPWEVIQDYSWPLQDTLVLHVRGQAGDHIIKASQTSHHIAREIEAYQKVLSGITAPIPRLQHADLDAGVLVTSFLPGELVLHSTNEWSPDVYRQAGEILAQIQVPHGMSGLYVVEFLSSVERLLVDASGLIPPSHFEALVNELGQIQSFPIQLHFTHGDYQPRNWLAHDGMLSVIDFGRGAQRSWVSDLVRLQNQQFLGHPELAAAFMEGLGRTLGTEDLEILRLETLRESVGTIVWAHRIGDKEFEEHGRQMIVRFLDSNAR
jgi:tRNA A-37 threonylcarbamoyl transferase component Bud32